MGTLLTIGLVLGILIAAYTVYMLVIAIVPFKPVPKQHRDKDERSPIEEVAQRYGTRKDVTFEVKGTSLHAWLYMPDSTPLPVPCVIMAHGFGGTKVLGLDSYALRFQQAGMSVLAFDFRHLGQSDGEPRQLVWIPKQLEDYAAAIEYARSLEEINSDKIALWGTSLSGGHVIVTAAKDKRVACVSSQVPLLSHEGGVKDIVKQVGLRNLLWMSFGHGLRDMVRSWLRLSPHKIPLFGRKGTIAAIADAGAWRLLNELAPPDFVNEVCARIMIRIDKYHPIKFLPKVRCPVLIQSCEKDIGLPKKVVEKAKNKLGELGEIIYYPIDHFDIYLGENFEQAVDDQLGFFRKHLLS